jgi:hypothetical protein
MTFAQLMELATATMSTAALIKEAMTATTMSISRLVSEMNEATTAAHLVMERASFNARLANRTAAVEARSCRDTIVVRTNNKFVVTLAALPNHSLPILSTRTSKEGATLPVADGDGNFPRQ